MCRPQSLIALTCMSVMAVAVVTVGLSCGSKINVQESITDFLPGETAGGLERSGEIRKYDRETLWEFLDGGADIYLDHGFVEMATTNYHRHELEFTADVYRFESPEKAQELYTIIRPPDVLQKVDIGQDGYLDPGMLTFVQGSYLVRLTGYIDTEESQNLLRDLAKGILRRMQVKQDGAANK